MYSDFYENTFNQPSIDNSEIYVKNNQIYDNETRATVPTKKESEPYDNLPRSLQTPVNAKCRCDTYGSQNTSSQNTSQKNMFTQNTSSKNMLSKFSNTMNQIVNPDSSKFTIQLSLTITDVIHIMVLIMVVILIAMTIRSRSRICFIAPNLLNNTSNNIPNNMPNNT